MSEWYLALMCAILGGFCGWALGHGSGVDDGIHRMQSQCVSRGVGDWAIDNSGVIKFTWRVQPKETQQ